MRLKHAPVLGKGGGGAGGEELDEIRGNTVLETDG